MLEWNGRWETVTLYIRRTLWKYQILCRNCPLFCFCIIPDNIQHNIFIILFYLTLYIALIKELNIVFYNCCFSETIRCHRVYQPCRSWQANWSCDWNEDNGRLWLYIWMYRAHSYCCKSVFVTFQPFSMLFYVEKLLLCFKHVRKPKMCFRGMVARPKEHVMMYFWL